MSDVKVLYWLKKKKQLCHHSLWSSKSICRPKPHPQWISNISPEIGSSTHTKHEFKHCLSFKIPLNNKNDIKTTTTKEQSSKGRKLVHHSSFESVYLWHIPSWVSWCLPNTNRGEAWRLVSSKDLKHGSTSPALGFTDYVILGQSFNLSKFQYVETTLPLKENYEIK